MTDGISRSHDPWPKVPSYVDKATRWMLLNKEESGWITNRSGKIVLSESGYSKAEYYNGTWAFNGKGENPSFQIDLKPMGKPGFIPAVPRFIRLSARGNVAINPGGHMAFLRVQLTDTKNKTTFSDIVLDESPRVFKDYIVPVFGELSQLASIKVMLVTDNGKCNVEIKDLKVEFEGWR